MNGSFIVCCDNETTVKQASSRQDFYTNKPPAKLKDKNQSLPEGKGFFSDSFPSEISNAIMKNVML